MSGQAKGRRAARATKRPPALEEIRRLLRQALPELREKYGVRSLGVFGSYVRSQPRRRSDLDVLVEFDRVPTLIEFVRLEREIASQVGIKVDLVMKSALKPIIGQHILEEVVPV